MKTKLLTLFIYLIATLGMNAFTVIALTGEAQGGWGDGFERDMTTTDGVHWILNGITTNAANSPTPNVGGLKFRADRSWADANTWGDPAFPSGTASQPGINIQCTAGTWDVTFNSTTGEYTFTPATPPTTVKLIGTAVPGGSITMNPTTPGNYSLPLTTFLAGTAKFEIGGVLDNGGSGFPTGDLLSGTTGIAVLAGAYTSVTFNNGDASYVFTAAPIFNTVGIIGSGTTGTNAGWSQEINMPTTDGVKYKLNLQLYSSNTTSDPVGAPTGVKFRKNASWADGNAFGGSAFTANNSTSSATGGDIVITSPGVYNVYFDLTSKVTNFVKEGNVSLVGAAAGGWPDSSGNPGPVDTYQMTTTDNDTFTLTGIAIVEGPLLFRQDNKWDVKFGGTSFPSGPAAPGDSGDIIVGAGQAGTYNITLVKSTGAYTFTNVTFATTSFANAGFKVSPNPTYNNWNFTSSKDAIVSIQVIDMLGKVVATSSSSTVDASALNVGVYFAKVTSANATATVKVVRN